MKESMWHGRAEGMDHDRGIDIDTLRDSIRVGKKKLQRGDLPPLSDNNAVSSMYLFVGLFLVLLHLLTFISCLRPIQTEGRSPSRGHSAPGLSSSLNVGALHATFPDEPEGIMLTAASASTLTNKGKPKAVKKFKKSSDVEARLMER